MIVIFTNPPSPSSGGTQVMFELGRRLAQEGETVSYWIRGRPLLTRHFFSSIRWNFFRVVREAFRYYFLIRPKMGLLDIKETDRFDRKHDVVIYPEVVSGNPLNANLVVRWILYFPGKLSRPPRFGSRDLFFHWTKEYMSALPSVSSTQLKLGLLLLPYYKNGAKVSRRNKQPLLLLRKGKKRGKLWLGANPLVIDGLEHAQIRELFYTHERMYSYDNYTAFLTYAAVCGCIPIVMPEEGVSIGEWLFDESDRYGMAYGEQEIDFAVKTRDKLLENLDKEEVRISNEINDFLYRIRSRRKAL